jgi:prepilin-type processing-associated H-X9-DG protein
MYWSDHENMSFRYQNGATNGGRLYWFGWIKAGSEGEREFDPTLGGLYPYLEERGPGICPSFDYGSTLYKYKAKGAAYGYGYNLFLGQASISMDRVTRPTEIAVFADAAQINDFQAPASAENPLLEEWYYIDDSSDYPNGHFRHREKANVLFCDGHVGGESPVPGSIDPRLPSQKIGRLPRACLFVP